MAPANPMPADPQQPMTPEPYTIWSFQWPFDKYGVPVRGNSGREIRPVVIMESETFRRLLADHPSLANAQFRVGTEGA